jgi:hypothetical protein
MNSPQHLYEGRPRKDHCGVDLISDALPFRRLWYGEPDAITNAIGYAKFYGCSHDAVIRVFNHAGNVIEDTRAGRRFSKRRKALDIAKAAKDRYKEEKDKLLCQKNYANTTERSIPREVKSAWKD